MRRATDIRRVIREWMEGEERHRVVEWGDGTFAHQRIWVEGGLGRTETSDIRPERAWDLAPEAAPGWYREQRWHAEQEARRRRVWWRRVLREAGWR